MKDTPLESLQYVYIGSHAFAMFEIFTGMWYVDDPLLNFALFECLLSLYGHTMNVPTLCSIFLDRSMISLHSSTMHVVKLEPYIQALFLAMKSLHFSSVWAWAKPMNSKSNYVMTNFFLLSVGCSKIAHQVEFTH